MYIIRPPADAVPQFLQELTAFMTDWLTDRLTYWLPCCLKNWENAQMRIIIGSLILPKYREILGSKFDPGKKKEEKMSLTWNNRAAWSVWESAG